MTQRQSGTDSTAGSNSLNDELHASLLVFLKKLGYRQTEQLFREEARSAGVEAVAFELKAEQDSSFQPSILLEKLNEANSSSPSSEEGGADGLYEQIFNKLKRWCYDSLDIYRDELCQILYPIFIHCFLDLIAKNLTNQAQRFFDKFKDEFQMIHGDEMTRLRSLNDNSQLKENSIASIYRNNKYNLTMSAYSFHLLVNFLQDNNLLILLKILNQYLNIRVLVSRSSSTPSATSSKVQSDKESKPQGISGLSPLLQSQINSEPLSWGVNVIDPFNELEIMKQLRNDLASSGTLKTQEQLNNAVNQIKKNLVGSPESAPKLSVLPRPLASSAEITLAVDRLKGLSSRALLSSTSLPSVCCYTVHNSYGGICSGDFSTDFGALAIGNRESFIDVWSLTKQQFRALRPSTELSAMSTADLENLDRIYLPDGSWSKRLVGHSGPVYACRFSPDSQFLYSCSQDGTIRLWSLATFSSVAVYKGHNGPVWDIDVSPTGHYFISGSSDRTIRLWCTQAMQPLRLFVGHLSDVDVVKFHPNSNYVFSGSSDKSVRMWDIHKGVCVRLFTGHARGISSLAVSSNGRLLASGDISGIVKIWDIAEGKLLKTLPAADTSSGNSRILSVYSLAFCQDGKVLASSYSNNYVKIWDLSLKPNASSPETPLREFPTRQTPVIAARFTPRNVLTVMGPISCD